MSKGIWPSLRAKRSNLSLTDRLARQTAGGLAMTFIACLLICRPAQAQTIAVNSISPTTINYETGNLLTGTTINFTIDMQGLVQVAVNCGIKNFGDTGTNVANLTQSYAAGGTYSLFWNGLWLMNGELSRTVTTCDFALTFSTNGASVTPVPQQPSTLVNLNSVDLNNFSVKPSVDANGAATAPYSISYTLAKDAAVTLTIANSAGSVVRTLLNNASQVAITTHTFTWDGLTDGGQPVPLGVYTATATAADLDPSISNSLSIPRAQTFSVQSLAGAATDPQKLFESNIYVLPNPVRGGSAFFNIVPVRDGATIHLRIYSIAGDIVFDQNVTGQTPRVPWNVSNQSGHKVGRGLYYYVVKETDPQGVLQVTKKMAVLP